MITFRVPRQPVRCGETTCAIEPGRFCPYLGARVFGTKPVCMLFDNRPLHEHDSGDKAGWLARCPECYAAQKAAEEANGNA